MWTLAALALAAATISPQRPFRGGPILVAVEAERQPRGQFLGQPLRFSFDAAARRWTAIAAIPLDTQPGRYPLEIDGATQQVTVAARKYRVSTIQVEPKFLEPPEEEKARIEAEREFKKKVFAELDRPRAWALPFRKPTNTIETSPFGSRRTYNGKTRSIHQGLDFRAAEGTQVRAIQAGYVAIARPMFFEGGLVVLNHGDGLFSLYMHLSGFLVKEGETVKAEQPIALSGNTGRSTAPHLHLGVQWRGTYVEPATMFRLRATPPAVPARKPAAKRKSR